MADESETPKTDYVNGGPYTAGIDFDGLSLARATDKLAMVLKAFYLGVPLEAGMDDETVEDKIAEIETQVTTDAAARAALGVTSSQLESLKVSLDLAQATADLFQRWAAVVVDNRHMGLHEPTVTIFVQETSDGSWSTKVVGGPERAEYDV